MDFYVETNKDIDCFDKGLSISLWNVAVQIAPYDTGNLRRSIVMSRNSPFVMEYKYNTMNAPYLHFLEEGKGPVKKHKGFIKDKTVGAFIVELISYLKTGEVNGITTIPKIQLNISSNGPMFYEKKIMKSFDVSWKQLTADDRRKMARFEFGTKNRLKWERQELRGSDRPTIHRSYKMSERIFRNSTKKELLGLENYIESRKK